MADERAADILAPGWVVTPGVSLAEARDEFLTDCQTRLKPKTIHYYRWGCNLLIAWLHEQRGIEDLAGVTAPLLREYMLGLKARGLQSSSVRAAVRLARCWFLFLEAEDLLPGKNPTHRVKMPKVPRRILPALSQADVRAILTAAQHTPTPERDQAIIFVLVDSGVRASELCGLTWGDVDLISGRVFIRAGKGDKDRYTFLGARAQQALAAYRATLAHAGPRDAVFQRAGQRFADGGLRYEGLKRLLRRLGAAAGVVNCHAHAFRRSFAVEMKRSGADSVLIARIMGHSGVVMLDPALSPAAD